MNREEKIKYALNKGITCNINTGKIYGIDGNIITRKHKQGYITIGVRGDDKKSFNILGHQFVYYCAYNKIVELIDHINGIKDDNRIINLREGNDGLNHQNRLDVKGYRKVGNRYQSRIKINRKEIYLGSFLTIEEAQEAYIDAKKIYHIW